MLTFCRVAAALPKTQLFHLPFQFLLAKPLVALLFHGRWEDSPLLSCPETAAAFVVTLVPAARSWHVLEAPLLRIGKCWRYE